MSISRDGVEVARVLVEVGCFLFVFELCCSGEGGWVG
jgi:hypothetical protein